ncbi:MAG: archaetidylserine decarboxylase [bacterium]
MYKKIFFTSLIVVLFLFIILGQKKYKNGNCYYNLKNELVCEKVEALVGLNFLYNNFVGKILRTVVNQRFISKFAGWYNGCWISKFKINSFIKKYDIDITEFLLSVKSFKSFNEFFIRKLKLEARPMPENQDVVISPADSKLFVIPNLSLDINFFVKNEKFNLNYFLQNKKLVEKYTNGTMLIFRLAPADYHRYHFPFDCFSEEAKLINGVFESVNPIAYKSGIQPFYKNERQLISLKTDLFGDVLLISVGAMLVGKIVNIYQPNENHKKGDEIGYFEYGGSTLVMLFEKDRVKIEQRFLDNSANGYETQVLMGQAIAK